MRITTVNQAINWVQSRLKFGIKPGLERMEWMMASLGNPERRLRAVHIAGTNGKGSSLTFLRSILQSAGYRVGAFTSPAMIDFTDRITINGQQISDEDFIELVNIIKPLVEELDELGHLGEMTEFEIITSMAFLYFGKFKPVDLALIEVGLGGRYDSTNILKPILTIITSIGLDHVNILGQDYGRIAQEKAGIIKNAVALISGVKQEEALKVIKNTSKEKRAPLYSLDRDIKVQDLDMAAGSPLTGELFSLKTPFASLEKLEIRLLGKHQIRNASLAVMAALYLKHFYAIIIDDRAIYQGLKKAQWPGRFEMISEKPLLILDGAHNEEAVKGLVKTVGEQFSNKSVKVLFSALEDKDLSVMIELLDGIAREISFTQFEHERAAVAGDMFELSRNPAKRLDLDWENALEKLISEVRDDEVLLVTGSLYFISEVRQNLQQYLR